MYSSYKYKFHVDMTCTACEANVRAALNKIPIVTKFNIQLKKKEVKIVTARYVEPSKFVKLLSTIKQTEVIYAPIHSDFINDSDWIINLPKEEIQRRLELQKWHESHEVDEKSHRVRIRTKSGITNQEVLIRQRFADAKIFQIQSKYQTLFFRIKGLNNNNIEFIKKALNEKKAYIKSIPTINTTTSVISFVANIETGKMNEFLNMLNEHIQKKLKVERQRGAGCTLELISEENQKNAEEKASLFFNNAKINLASFVALIFLLPYVGLPVTLLGQFLGGLTGFITLGIIWKTGGEFYKEAWRSLKNGTPYNMHSLFTFGTLYPWIYSMMLVFFPSTFMVASLSYQFLPINMILTMINIGQGVKVLVQEKTEKLVQSIENTFAQYQAQYADKVTEKTNDINFAEFPQNRIQIPYQEVKKGDIILVKKDTRFPIDGVIISNSITSVEQSALTGENKAIEKKNGESIFGGSLNIGNPVLIQAKCDGGQGVLSQILKQVNKSKSTIPPISEFINTISRWLIPAIFTIAVVSGSTWYLLGNTPMMLNSVMSVLLCACPCALGFSITASSIGLYTMFMNKIIVRDTASSEMLAKVDTVVVDKTGTLTIPKIKECFITPTKELDEATILIAAAKLEKKCDKSDHPIAQKIIEMGHALHSSNIHVTNKIDSSDTQGVSGIVMINDKPYKMSIGSKNYLIEKAKCKISSDIVQKGNQHLKKGMTTTYLAIGAKCIGLVGLEHDLRKGTEKAIEGLKRLDIDVYMLTGDKEGPARAIAKKLKIDRLKVFSNKKYDKENCIDEKQEIIRNLKKTGRTVAMVGDGVNDYLAMKEADVSIAAGTWTNTANKSHLVLQKFNVDSAIVIARETMKIIKQNIMWTLFYNAISIGFASGLFYPLFGVMLNPAVASLMMSLSSIFVLINSNRLSFDVKERLKIHKGRIVKPSSFFDKLKQLFSVRTFFKTIKMLARLSIDVKDNIPGKNNISAHPTALSDIATPRQYIPAQQNSCKRTPKPVKRYMDEFSDTKPRLT